MLGTVLFVVPAVVAEFTIGILILAGAWEWSGFLGFSEAWTRALVRGCYWRGDDCGAFHRSRILDDDFAGRVYLVVHCICLDIFLSDADSDCAAPGLRRTGLGSIVRSATAVVSRRAGTVVIRVAYRVGRRYRGVFCRPSVWPRETRAQHQSGKNLGGRSGWPRVVCC